MFLKWWVSINFNILELNIRDQLIKVEVENGQATAISIPTGDSKSSSELLRKRLIRTQNFIILFIPEIFLSFSSPLGS